MKIYLKYIIVAAVAGVLLLSCNNSGTKATNNMALSYSKLENANWLIGEWHNNSAEGSATEIWEKKNDSTLSAISYFIAGTDTVLYETIILQQIGNSLFYIPTVKNQNNNEPVKFELAEDDGKHLVFENPGHDFPQKISYTQLSGDSMVAEISGTIEGKLNSQKFPMKRVK